MKQLRLFMLLFIFAVVLVSTVLGVAAQGRPYATSFIVWSPDGQKIAVSGTFGIRVYMADLHLAPTQIANAGIVNHIAWSPDSGKLAAANEDSSVKIWDIQTGLLSLSLMGHTDKVSSVTWSPDGTKVASGSWDGTVRIWDLPTAQTLYVLQNGRHVAAVGWSPDGNKLVAAAGGSNWTIWNPSTGTQLIRQDSRSVSSPSVSWKSDSTAFLLDTSGQISATTGLRGLTTLCSAGSQSAAIWSRDGAKIAMISSDESGEPICIVDLTTSQVTHIAVLESGSDANSVAISPDNMQVATVEEDGHIWMWDANNGNVVSEVPNQTLTPLPTGQNLSITALCSPDPTQHRYWRVINPNVFEVWVDWKLNDATTHETPSSTNQWGHFAIAAATNGVAAIKEFSTETLPGVNTLRIYSPLETLQDIKDSITDSCPTGTPTVSSIATRTTAAFSTNAATAILHFH